ncbi:MAG: hypothetical protein OSB65_00620 [Roseibacillus sp.]|jgi:hypothetical protein|nr:hypothetical protein [Roseibacillus sp.]
MRYFFRPTGLILGALMALATTTSAQKLPAVLGDYLKLDAPVRGQVVIVEPPKEIGAYVRKVEQAAKADPEWFTSYSKSSKAGLPLPFHEKLGLTKKEYDLYNKLWDERKMNPVKNGNVVVRLEKTKKDDWMIRVSGKGVSISLLRYEEKADVVKSPNGLLTRLKDIDADPRSILGNWTGHEWKFEQEDGLGKTKENFAIGKLVGTKYGLLVYRLQSTSLAGRLLYDKSMVIRFPLAVK